MEIISQISSFALTFIENTGYLGIFILSALESAAIPIPSEVVAPFSGFLASTGKFSLWGVVAIITLANTVGSVILFVVGASGGRWILEKYGKYILIHKRELERADEWFRKHGGAAIFWSRLLPAIRSIISLPAGVARMNFLKFTLFTAAGSLPWNFVLAYLGYKAGQNWESLKPYFEKLNSLVFGVLVLAAVWYLWKHLPNHKKEKAA